MYCFRKEVRVQLCCGRLTGLNALVWPVWNLLHITFEYILPHCSFVSSVKTLSHNCVYKSICTLLSKIRMKYFFSFHYSLEFKRKPQIIWPSFRPLALKKKKRNGKNNCFMANEEDAFPFRPSQLFMSSATRVCLYHQRAGSSPHCPALVLYLKSQPGMHSATAERSVWKPAGGKD